VVLTTLVAHRRSPTLGLAERTNRYRPIPMGRSIWSGTISFGLIVIPVKLFRAVRSREASFNQLDDRTMGRIRYQKVSDDTGEEVPSDQIVKVLRDLPGPRFQRIDRRSATVTSARLTTLPVARGVDVRAVVRWSLSDAFVRIPLIPTPASTT
jgi:Ku70/Ku80 beta-barrel domain